jgi:hypothetical protein
MEVSMHDSDQATQRNRGMDHALLHAQLAPTAEALRERLGAGWTSTVDTGGLYRAATLRHDDPDFTVVLHVSTPTGDERPYLHINVGQDFNNASLGTHVASALVHPGGNRFDPDQVHAALRQAVAETHRLKARATAHTAVQAVLDTTLRRLRHADPDGLHARTFPQLHAEFVADLAEAMAALRDAPANTGLAPA